MSKEKDFDKGHIYTLVNYFYWFIMGNLYFLLLNIPVFLVLMKINYFGAAETSLLEIYLACIPIGPSITALFGVMGTLIRKKDINITKDYFRMYKMNFKQSIILWLMVLTVLFILYVDIATAKNLFVYLYILLFLLVMMISLYMLPITSRFYLKTKDIIIISIIKVFKEIKITLLLLVTVAFSFLIFNFMPGISILFIISALCFTIMYLESALLMKMEEDLASLEKESN